MLVPLLLMLLGYIDVRSAAAGAPERRDLEPGNATANWIREAVAS